MRIRMTGVLTTRSQAFALAERLGRALEDTCFAYEVPNSGPYRKAYKLGYRFAVCTRFEKPAHFARGIIFIEPCEEDELFVKNRIRRRQAREARAAKKKPLTSNFTKSGAVEID